jgi:trans-aconitate methyltransferase
LRSLFPKLEKAVGIDNNAGMLATARERSVAPWIEYIHLDMMQLERLTAQQFDMVISHCALHWVKDKAAVFHQLEKYIHPGSHLMVGTYDRFPDLLKVIDDHMRAQFNITEPLAVHLLNWEEWEDLLAEHRWRVVKYERKPKKHVVEAGMPFLKYWYASSSGAAFYGHTLDKLPKDFISRMLSDLDKKFPGSRAHHWDFPEVTLYFVAEKMG